MKVKTIIEEDFSNYKKPSMLIASICCTWKCCKEAGIPITVCQNESIASQPDIDIPDEDIFERYKNNPITSAIVIGGLEPILQFSEVYHLLEYFREYGCNDDFVIYTGYTPEEISYDISMLKIIPNVVMKFGRYKPNCKPHYDDVLGVNLISDNQYGKRIS